MAPEAPSVAHPPAPPVPPPAPVAPPVEPTPPADVEHTAVLPTTPGYAPPAAAATPAAERPMYVEERVESRKPRKEKAKKEKAPAVPKPPKDRPPLVSSLPEIAPVPASAIVGAVVGLLACGATWLALQGCEAIRGTSSCGGPGFLVLVAILILLVLAGVGLLRLVRVPQPPSTSLLAVGLLSMITLLVFSSWIFEWWSVLVITPLSAGCYVLAQWVTRHSADE